MSRRTLTGAFSAVALALFFVWVSATADAAFPGRNGRIAYGIYEATTSGRDLWWIGTMLPDGSARRLISARADAPAFSPSGRRIAYGDEYSGYLQTVSASGGRIRRLTHDPSVDIDGLPDWSPSGRRLVFARTYTPDPLGQDISYTDLWIHYARGDRLLARDASAPAWSVRGEIAFTRQYDLHPLPGIYGIRPDGSGLRQISPRGFAPDWSPDGRKIVCRVGSDIAVMRADGSGFRRLTHGPASDTQPAFSPDGKRIVFLRADWLVRTITTEGKHLRRLGLPQPRFPSSGFAVSNPDWQPLPKVR